MVERYEHQDAGKQNGKKHHRPKQNENHVVHWSNRLMSSLSS
jgi:hypothetical protein